MSPEEIIKFWFHEIDSILWWKKDKTFDERIRRQYAELHRQASACELVHWRESAKGRLAEIIILDQFSRNMYRDTAAAFAHDAQALTLAQEAVANKADLELDAIQRVFLYLPYMHSESLLIHEDAVRLFTDAGMKDNLDFEFKHKAIIERFGRYPHRNAILGRVSSTEEVAFLEEPGSSF